MNSMKGTIFALVGSSGVGKTYLVEHITKKMGNVKIIKSTTTRPSRGPEDLKHYHFISPEEFQKRLESGGFATSAEYAGNFYGYERSELDSVLADSNGIFAILEPVVDQIRSSGYEVKTIHIVSDHNDFAHRGREISEERKQADIERSKHHIDYDLEIVNSFDDHGHSAMQNLIEFIGRNASIPERNV
jgi:guanylate kinase